MIERLLIAAGITVTLLALGIAIRSLSSRRTATRLATVTIPAASHPRLLVFSSRWCSDCETQRRVIEGARDSWSRVLEISYHDAARESELASRFGILTVPALVVAAADGRVLHIAQGLADEDRLRSLIATAA